MGACKPVLQLYTATDLLCDCGQSSHLSGLQLPDLKNKMVELEELENPLLLYSFTMILFSSSSSHFGYHSVAFNPKGKPCYYCNPFRYKWVLINRYWGKEFSLSFALEVRSGKSSKIGFMLGKRAAPGKMVYLTLLFRIRYYHYGCELFPLLTTE